MERSTLLAGLLLIILALTSTVASAASPRETLSKEALNASAWAVAGLEETVPSDIRRNLTFLREDLLDEGSAATQANAASYKLGSALCDALIAALDEREQAAVRAGYRAAQANAATKVTNADLEVRRNYTMSWPQYAREQSQRSELTRQMNNQTSLAKEAVRVEWSTRAAQLRRNLDELYRRYREALRQHANFQGREASPQQPAVEKPKVEAPAAVRAPVAKMEGAAINIACSEVVRILPLEAGQKATYDSPGSWRIKRISSELSGWQFVCIPFHKITSYEIRVNQDGVLYAFGGGTKKLAKNLGAEETSKWEDADGAISGPTVRFCLRRKVTAGEIIKLNDSLVQLAAKSIELVRDGK